jgi:hypothetical protein
MNNKMSEISVTKNKAVSAFGITCPFIREGDNIASIIVDSILNSRHTLDDMDVIGITESVVARAQGNYVTVDELAEEIQRFVIGKKKPVLMLYKPIYSRNRFAVILRAFARACSKIVLVMPDVDEVGNPVSNHPFTGLDYKELYNSICKEENCECWICDDLGNGKYPYTYWHRMYNDVQLDGCVDCGLHNFGVSDIDVEKYYSLRHVYTLYDFCKDKCDWGLLGSNKVNEEKLKLFPSKGGAQAVCDIVKESIKEKTGKDVVVCVYGDGCFASPKSETNPVSISEWADPCSCPSYTNKELMESSPNEIKLKALIDNAVDDNEVHVALSQKMGNNLKNEKTMGTTPRLRKDLLASLMDLMSGSGERATPCVLVKNYF